MNFKAVRVLMLFAMGLLTCGLVATHAVDWSRYHFGLKTCVDAPNGTCDVSNVACNSCSQMRPPEIFRSNLNFGMIASVLISSKEKSTLCYRKDLNHSPSWISTAIWVDRKSEIMVVDPNKNQVLLYTVTGQQTKFPTEFDRKTFVESTARASDSYVLKMLGANGMVFNADLELMEPDVNFQRNKSGRNNGLGSLYDWIASEKRLFAFGTIKTEDSASSSRRYASGFIDAAIEGRPFSIDDVRLRVPFEYLDYYLLGHRYVATGIGSGYFLKMDSTARIYRVPFGAGDPELLNVMPRELEKVPRIKTPARGPGDAKNLFDEISGYSIPVGLYGYRDKIYLLGRTPSGRKTNWWFYQIDPVGKRVTAKLRLPTSAEHVTIVLSPSYLFVFEKGMVKDDSSQDIKSLLAIPVQWIVEASSSPLKHEVTCVSGRIEG